MLKTVALIGLIVLTPILVYLGYILYGREKLVYLIPVNPSTERCVLCRFRHLCSEAEEFSENCEYRGYGYLN